MDRSPTDEFVLWSPLGSEIPPDPVLLDLNTDELASAEQRVAGEVDNILSEEDSRFNVTSLRDVDTDTDSDDDDDGLYYEDTLSEAGPVLEDDGFGNDDDQVIVASDAYSWKIDHSKGDHKLRARELVTKTSSAGFDGRQAIEMLQRSYTIDYGSRKDGSRPATAEDEYYPGFFLDLIILVGRPLKPITQPSARFFDNVTISFKNWRAPYAVKHSHGLPFELDNRTFRLATAATRESWYIVMHPVVAPVTELPSSRRERSKRREKSIQSSALRIHHAQFLAAYIKQVFLISELLGEGIEPSWKLDGPQSQRITFNKWTAFQNRFMEDWDAYVEEHSCDSFWTENQPAFHAYDYGANIEIEVNEQLQSLPKETRLRGSYENSDSESSDGDVDEQEDSTRADTTRSGQSSSSQRPSHRLSPETEEEAELPSGVDDQVFYTKGLHELRTELELKYRLENISSISYALAVDLNCLDGASPDPDSKLAFCLLADRNKVSREFGGPREFTFYPLAFHPAYGNFSSPRPPSFLADNVLAIMRDNMSFQNDGADVLSCGYFQAYSNIKRSIRHGADDLLASKGIATAALTLPESEANTSNRNKAKRQRLLQHLRGMLTPEDPDSSRPFMREQRRVETAIAGEEFAFRMEQVISIHVSRLTDRNRTFSTILRPIFQLIRFYLQEAPLYTHLLRCFRPSIFPGVLASFGRMFGLAMDEMQRRFEARGSKGVGAALAEGVAALDRLGSYCFTGSPKTLMGSVLEPLGAIDAIKQGAWPFIDPRMLSLQEGEGSLNVARWPRGSDGRPLLMHVAALAFHYGPQVAASRHSHVWFKELGGMSIGGPLGATRYLEELFRDMWIPQTTAFVRYRFDQALGRGNRDHASQRTREELGLLEQQRSMVESWSQSEHPFSWA